MNFNRIWILHVSLYWFFTAYNSPRVYAPRLKKFPSTWSAVAFGGAVLTFIMILATLAEFLYIPTTWNSASYLTTRLVFLHVILALMARPTFYIAMIDDLPTTCKLSIPLIIGVVQFFVYYCVRHSSFRQNVWRLFGRQVAKVYGIADIYSILSCLAPQGTDSLYRTLDSRSATDVSLSLPSTTTSSVGTPPPL